MIYLAGNGTTSCLVYQLSNRLNRLEDLKLSSNPCGRWDLTRQKFLQTMQALHPSVFKVFIEHARPMDKRGLHNGSDSHLYAENVYYVPYVSSLTIYITCLSRAAWWNQIYLFVIIVLQTTKIVLPENQLTNQINYLIFRGIAKD